MKKIALVDDDPDLTAALQLILQDEGFCVDLFNCLTDLAIAWRTSMPDVLIIDYRLPDGNGIDWVCAQRERLGDFPPTIMISAKDTMKEEALNSGIDHFLAKPFAIEDLLAKVRDFVQMPSLMV